LSALQHVLGVVDIYRLTAFGPAELDLAVCLSEILASSMAKASFQSLSLKRKSTTSSPSATSASSAPDANTSTSPRNSLDEPVAA